MERNIEKKIQNNGREKRIMVEERDGRQRKKEGVFRKVLCGIY